MSDLYAEERFVAMLKQLLERTRDPQVHDRIWDYREGRTTRSQLYRDEAFVRELKAWYAEATAEQHALGHTPDRVRARLAELRGEGRLVLDTDW